MRKDCLTCFHRMPWDEAPGYPGDLMASCLAKKQLVFLFVGVAGPQTRRGGAITDCPAHQPKEEPHA